MTIQQVWPIMSLLFTDLKTHSVMIITVVIYDYCELCMLSIIDMYHCYLNTAFLTFAREVSCFVA